MALTEYFYAPIFPDSLPDSIGPETRGAIFYGTVGIAVLTSVIVLGLLAFLIVRIRANWPPRTAATAATIAVTAACQTRAPS